MNDIKMERIAEDISKFHPGWSERYRDFCRAMADDLELNGRQRAKFLSLSHAPPVAEKVAS